MTSPPAPGPPWYRRVETAPGLSVTFRRPRSPVGWEAASKVPGANLVRACQVGRWVAVVPPSGTYRVHLTSFCASVTRPTSPINLILRHLRLLVPVKYLPKKQGPSQIRLPPYSATSISISVSPARQRRTTRDASDAALSLPDERRACSSQCTMTWSPAVPCLRGQIAHATWQARSPDLDSDHPISPPAWTPARLRPPACHLVTGADPCMCVCVAAAGSFFNTP